MRNDWLESLKRGKQLCEQNAHQGDAATIQEVIDYLQDDKPKERLYQVPYGADIDALKTGTYHVNENTRNFPFGVAPDAIIDRYVDDMNNVHIVTPDWHYCRYKGKGDWVILKYDFSEPDNANGT